MTPIESLVRWRRSGPILVLAVLVAGCGEAEQAPAADSLDQGTIELLEHLNSDNEMLRYTAAMELSERQEPLPASIVPALGPLLKDPNISVRSYVARVLGRIGPASIPVLIEAIKSRDRLVRSTTIDGFREIGPDAAPALLEVAAIDNGYFNPDVDGVYDALFQLGLAVIPHLIHGVESQTGSVRYVAAQVLGRFSAKARSAIPALISALAHEDLSSIAALGALKDIGAEVVPPLTQALGDPARGERLRWSAAMVLGNLGLAAGDAAPALRSALKDASWRVRHSAALALAKVDPASTQEARVVLVEMAKDSDEQARRAAEKGLKVLEAR